MLNFEEKWKLIFRKYPKAKYNRAEAYWLFGEEFYGFTIYATKHQLMEFFKDYATIERSCREILKTPEFKPDIQQDSKRYEKAAEFKQDYKTPKEDYMKYLI